jgi:biopolymer transport protein ExbB/TolQ
MVFGVLLLGAPLVGLVGTVLGMNRAFAELGHSGISDPEALGSQIGTTLLSTAAGLFLLPVGVIVFAASLTLFLYLRGKTPPPLPPGVGR